LRKIINTSAPEMLLKQISYILFIHIIAKHKRRDIIFSRKSDLSTISKMKNYFLYAFFMKIKTIFIIPLKTFSDYSMWTLCQRRNYSNQSDFKLKKQTLVCGIRFRDFRKAFYKGLLYPSSQDNCPCSYLSVSSYRWLGFLFFSYFSFLFHYSLEAPVQSSIWVPYVNLEIITK
jgi:hypothetical protein